MLIVAGSASSKLAERVAKQLRCELTKPELKRFPDGELYVRIPADIKGEDVAIIQSTCYPPNQNYMELFLLLDAARDLGAGEITAIIPYFAYARQDKRFKGGEAVSLHTSRRFSKSLLETLPQRPSWPITWSIITNSRIP